MRDCADGERDKNGRVLAGAAFFTGSPRTWRLLSREPERLETLERRDNESESGPWSERAVGQPFPEQMVRETRA